MNILLTVERGQLGRLKDITDFNKEILVLDTWTVFIFELL